MDKLGTPDKFNKSTSGRFSTTKVRNRQRAVGDASPDATSLVTAGIGQETVPIATAMQPTSCEVTISAKHVLGTREHHHSVPCSLGSASVHVSLEPATCSIPYVTPTDNQMAITRSQQVHGPEPHTNNLRSPRNFVPVIPAPNNNTELRTWPDGITMYDGSDVKGCHLDGIKCLAPSSTNCNVSAGRGVANSVLDLPNNSVGEVSLRTLAWRQYDLSAGTLWGKDLAFYKQLLEQLPPSLTLHQASAQTRRLVDPSALRERRSLDSLGLRGDLSCPICMCIWRNPVVVKSCLHRFCAECIEKCVRIGIRECPQCRSHVASRRALRVDPIFDRVVRRLFPDVRDFEDRNAILLAKANRRFHMGSDTTVDDRVDDLMDITEIDMWASEQGDDTNRKLKKTVAKRRGWLPDLNVAAVDRSNTATRNWWTVVDDQQKRHRDQPPAFIGLDGRMQHRNAPLRGGSSSDCSGSTNTTAAFYSSINANTPAIRHLTFSIQRRLVGPERKRARKELSATVRRIPVHDKLMHFELVADPLLASLPQVVPRHLATNGSFTVLHLARFLVARLQQMKRRGTPVDVQELRLYSKEHRAPFGPNLTLAALHPLSLAYHTQTLVLYYSSRPYADGGGGVLRGVRGHVADLWAPVTAPTRAVSGSRTDSEVPASGISASHSRPEDRTCNSVVLKDDGKRPTRPIVIGDISYASISVTGRSETRTLTGSTNNPYEMLPRPQPFDASERNFNASQDSDGTQRG